MILSFPKDRDHWRFLPPDPSSYSSMINIEKPDLVVTA